MSTTVKHNEALEKRSERTITLYRDDSTVQVIFKHVKTTFWTANNSVFVISKYANPTGHEHYYIQWPRERFCWFKDELTKN